MYADLHDLEVPRGFSRYFAAASGACADPTIPSGWSAGILPCLDPTINAAQAACCQANSYPGFPGLEALAATYVQKATGVNLPTVTPGGGGGGASGGAQGASVNIGSIAVPAGIAALVLWKLL